MKIDSIYFKGHRCFKNDWVGFEQIKPVNIIIGRNNSGKSHLLSLVEECCKETLKNTKREFYCKAVLDEDSIRSEFPQGRSGGELPRDHWLYHGEKFLNQEIEWQRKANGSIAMLRTIQSDMVQEENPHDKYIAYSKRVGAIAERAYPPLSGKIFRQIVADRDLKF